jgi:hypothetical protein
VLVEVERELTMPKWVLFAVVAVGDFIVAVVFYQNGRVVLPLILGVAGLCLLIAAMGSARQAKRDGM